MGTDSILISDMNGNLTGAYRQGMVNDDVSDPYHTYDTMDDYVVEYNGNQKRSVNGTGAGNPSYFGSSSFVDGMPEGDNEYAYNANGAMTKDLNKGINDITYDLLGNLREITMSDNRSIRYVYAADGTRLRTTHKRKVGNTYLRDSTEYLGNLIVKNGQPVMYRFSGGYFAFDNGALSDCHYYIQDYLGSNRMVVSKGGSVKQSNHYYPYGGIIGGIDFNPTLQPYKFEDKELDRTYGLDWYDIHARQYDPVVPSWHTIDPLAEKYYSVSPYAYCLNNPNNRIDRDGRDSYYTQNGHYIGKDNKLSDNIIIRRELSGRPFKSFNGGWSTQYVDTQLMHENLSAEAYSNIFTHVIENMGLDTKQLYGGKIAVAVFDSNSNESKSLSSNYDPQMYSPDISTNAITTHINNDLIGVAAIITNGSNGNSYMFNTISNVQNLLGIHELKLHGIDNISDERTTYEKQMQDPSWEKTTDEFKKQEIDHYNSYFR